nr:MAG TPA: Relaxin-like protein [Caudoviricetes sp.]
MTILSVGLRGVFAMLVVFKDCGLYIVKALATACGSSSL